MNPPQLSLHPPAQNGTSTSPVMIHEATPDGDGLQPLTCGKKKRKRATPLALLHRQLGCNNINHLLHQQMLRSLGPVAKRNAGVPVFNIEWHPLGHTLVVVGEDTNLRLYDAHNANIQHRVINAHDDNINIARFMSDRHFVTASDDNSIRLWDIRNLAHCVRSFAGHEGWVKNVEPFSSRYFLSAGFDGTVRIWDLEANEPHLNGTRTDHPHHNHHHTLPSMGIGESLAQTNGVLFKREGVARMALSPASSRLIISLTSGHLLVFHELDLTRPDKLLDIDVPTLCRLADGKRVKPFSTITDAAELPREFVRHRNRLEVLYEPSRNGYATSLQVSACGRYLLSRRHMHNGKEVCCVFDLEAPHSDPEQPTPLTSHQLSVEKVDSPSAQTYPLFPSRLLFYVPDSSSGSGFIKEPCFSSAEPYYVCSPYYKGLRMFCLKERKESKEDSHAEPKGGLSPTTRSGRRLMSTSAMLQHMQPRKWRACLNTHDAPVLTCRYHPFLPELASGGLDGKVVLYAGGQTGIFQSHELVLT